MILARCGVMILVRCESNPGHGEDNPGQAEDIILARCKDKILAWLKTILARCKDTPGHKDTILARCEVFPATDQHNAEVRGGGGSPAQVHQRSPSLMYTRGAGGASNIC